MIPWIKILSGVWWEHLPWIIIQNTVFLSVILLILRWLRPFPAKIRYQIGLIGLIKCLLPPFIPAPFLMKSVALPLSFTVLPASPVQAETLSLPAPALGITENLFLFWFVSAIFYLCAAVLNNLRLNFRLKNVSAEDVAEGRYKVPVLLTDAVTVPMTHGWFSPKIYVPGHWEKWSAAQRKMIVEHELAHIHRKDQWAGLLQIVGQAFYLFHPLIYLLNQKINEYREMACDDLTVGPERQMSVEYARILVQIAEELKQSQLGLTSASALIRQKHELFNRVQYQMEELMKQTSRWKTGLILGTVLLLILPLSWIRAVSPAAPPPGTGSETVSMGKVFGKVVSNETGEPLSGANISINGLQKGAAADNNGNFFIPQLPVPVPEKAIDDEVVFVPYETPPVPEGGFAAIQEKLYYPEMAVKSGVEGRVIIQALIDANGTVKNTKVVQSLGQTGCDEAAIQAVRSVKWHPAISRDQPVQVWVTVPVDFYLRDKNPQSSP